MLECIQNVWLHAKGGGYPWSDWIYKLLKLQIRILNWKAFKMYHFTFMEVGIHVQKPIPLLLVKHKKKLQIIHILLKLLSQSTLLNFNHHLLYLSQPHFGLSVRVKPTLPNVGTWSPPGLPKTQSSSWRAKTPRIGVFLVSLEISWSVDV